MVAVILSTQFYLCLAAESIHPIAQVLIESLRGSATVMNMLTMAESLTSQ